MKRKILSVLCILSLAMQPGICMASDDTDFEQSTINISEETENIELNDDFEAQYDEDLFEEQETDEEETLFKTDSIDADKTALSYIINNLDNCALDEVSPGNTDKLGELKQKAESVYQKSDASQEEVDAVINEVNEYILSLNYSYETQIISGNKFDSFQLSEYFNNMKVFNNAVGYVYGESSPEVLKNADTRQKLSDGKISEYIQTTSTDTGDTELIYDFGKEYYICGAELFSGFYYNVGNPQRRNRRNVGKYRIMVSNDGEDYITVSEAEAKTRPDDGETGILDYVITTKTDIAAVKARYVKVIIEKDNTAATVSGQQDGSIYYKLGEMVIKGIPVVSAREMLLAAINNCSGVDKEFYSADTYDAWESAWNKAERTWFNENSSDKELKEAASGLEEAFGALKRQERKYIISGNLKSKDDLSYYPEYSNRLGMNVTYTYGPEGTWGTASNTDISLTALLMGNLGAKSVPDMAWGRWEGRKGDIIVDLHRTCYITEADLWTMECAAKNGTVEKIVVYVSDDGITYQEAGAATFEPDPAPADWTIYRRSVPFSKEMKGRYVKYSLSTSTYQMNVGELVILGMAGTSENEGIPCPISNMSYTDEDGILLYTLNGSENIKASGYAENATEEVQTVKVITAAYNEKGQLVSAVWSDKTIAPNSMEYFENDINVPGINSGYSVKTYVWSGLSNGRPLSQVKSFGRLK